MKRRKKGKRDKTALFSRRGAADKEKFSSKRIKRPRSANNRHNES